MNGMNGMSHNNTFSENERRLLSIIRSLQDELLQCKNDLADKEALLKEAKHQLHDILNWGRFILEDLSSNHIINNPITSHMVSKPDSLQGLKPIPS